MMNYEQHDAVALLHFDDGKANVVGHALIEALNDGLEQAEKDARAVVLLGREGLFSGGFDLKEMKRGPEAAMALVESGGRMLLRLFTHPQPVIAACTGHAIAAGALMLLASDTRLGVRGDFKIVLNETAIGMALPVFGLELARCRLANQYHSAAVIQSSAYNPEQAVEVGYLDRLVGADELQQRAIEQAAQLAELPTETYHANKCAIRREYIELIEQSLAPAHSA